MVLQLFLPFWVLQSFIKVYVQNIAHLGECQQVPTEMILGKTPPIGCTNNPALQPSLALLDQREGPLTTPKCQLSLAGQHKENQCRL